MPARVLALSLLLTLFAAPFHTQGQANPLPARIVGYYAGWAIYDPQYFVTNIPADKLTHLNYAFADVSADGEVVAADPWGDTQFPYPGEDENAPLLGNFHQLQLLKQAHPNLRTLISVGGWTQSAHFSDAALSAESRTKFARSAVAFVTKYGFDGIDIDWEYPTGGGADGNTERPEDAANFVLLLSELRSELSAQGAKDGHTYLLTIALGASPEAYRTLDWPHLAPLLDWINVMTYDMAGDFSTVTGFNAPLFNSADNPPEGMSTDSTIISLLALGIPADQLVVGVPFYGRGWIGVGPDNNGLHQPFKALAPGTWDLGDFDYDDLAAHYIGKFQRFWDARAQSPWLYDPTQQIMISYEDPESLAAKARYVRERGLGGVMIWELSIDRTGTLLTALADALNGPVPAG